MEISISNVIEFISHQQILTKHKVLLYAVHVLFSVIMGRKQAKQTAVLTFPFKTHDSVYLAVIIPVILYPLQIPTLLLLKMGEL